MFFKEIEVDFINVLEIHRYSTFLGFGIIRWVLVTFTVLVKMEKSLDVLAKEMGCIVA